MVRLLLMAMELRECTTRYENPKRKCVTKHYDITCTRIIHNWRRFIGKTVKPDALFGTVTYLYNSICPKIRSKNISRSIKYYMYSIWHVTPVRGSSKYRDTPIYNYFFYILFYIFFRERTSSYRRKWIVLVGSWSKFLLSRIGKSYKHCTTICRSMSLTGQYRDT